MHARVTTFIAQPDKIDELIKVTRDTVLPAIKNQKGFRHLFYLTNRNTSKCVALVVWDSEDAMTAGEASQYYLLDMLLKTTPLSAKPPTREHYEVGVQG